MCLASCALLLESRQIGHTRGAPYHAMSQGKVERCQRSMKNLVQPQTFQYPWDLEQEISRFVDYPGLRPIDNRII
jgi:hypothetical protein